jgi:hypothetical protein
MPSKKYSGKALGTILREILNEGEEVEIDGLGLFRPRIGGEFDFVPETKPRLFLAYAAEDLPAVRMLYDSLVTAGCLPWLDREKLLPGQNWPRSIERAIHMSDFFVPCFSKRSANKPGGFHSEMRYALDCASRLPLDDIFIMPVRLDNCRVPNRITAQIQYVDLFPDWKHGFDRLMSSMRNEMKNRRRQLLELAC